MIGLKFLQYSGQVVWFRMSYLSDKWKRGQTWSQISKDGLAAQLAELGNNVNNGHSKNLT